ncbi:MAG TPA: CocE/NonD family hydrolase [Gaiellaceae bacterium]|nr:CocE/NonD family hydrolase [Gaiellaceae bacterium]
MGRARVVVVILAAALVCAGGASAAPGWSEVTITASDATPLACAYIIPSGTAPAGGWPGVILFHGLGQSHTDMEPYGSALAQFGFAALACDARGTGASGGKFGLDGPRDVQDAQDLFTWFARRPDVSNTAIGAFGLSLGGGEVWNAAVAGVPFKAIVPAITWTDLGQALNPNGVPKDGEIARLEAGVPASRLDPSLAQGLTASVEAARSSRSKLHSLSVPTLMLQGRHDFLFDLDQAVAAYRLLAGPKRLYLGDIGHPPAKNPSAEAPTYLTEVVGWFNHYLAGGPNLVGGGVELAHDPWDGKTSFYRRVPATRRRSVNLPGTRQLTGTETARRSVRLPGGPFETFGDSSLTVHYSDHRADSKQLRATISVKGSKTPVTFGAARVTAQAGVVRIPFSDQAVLLPRGKRLVVTVGMTTADGVYRPISGTAVELTIGRITLNLSLLKRAVSK